MIILVENDTIVEVRDLVVYGTASLAPSAVYDADLEVDIVYAKEDDENLITGLSNASPMVVTSAGHGLSNGDKVLVRFAEGNTAANREVWTVANKTANTFELSGSTGNGTWTGEGEFWLVVTNGDGIALTRVTGTNSYRGTAQGSLGLRLDTQYNAYITDVDLYSEDLAFFPSVDIVERVS